MQLHELTKPLSEYTEEELLERVKQIRHNRTVERPAAKARTVRKAAKGSVTKMSKMHAMLAAMSDEDKKALLAQLGVDDSQLDLPMGDN